MLPEACFRMSYKKNIENLRNRILIDDIQRKKNGQISLRRVYATMK